MCLFRGVSCKVGESASAGYRPSASSSIELTFRGSASRSLRAYLVSTRSLSALSRFRAAPSGIRFATSVMDLNPPPLLSSRCSSPRSFTTTIQPHSRALANAPLLGFGPLQRSTESGVRMTRQIQLPAPYVLRVSHPLDVLLRPKPCRACFIPAALVGFSRTSAARTRLSARQG